MKDVKKTEPKALFRERHPNFPLHISMVSWRVSVIVLIDALLILLILLKL